MTFVRTLNGIIYGMDGVEHGDSVIACLNNIIGPETRFEKSDDAVEYLVKQYVEGGEGGSDLPIEIIDMVADPDSSDLLITTHSFADMMLAFGRDQKTILLKNPRNSGLFGPYAIYNGSTSHTAEFIGTKQTDVERGKMTVYTVHKEEEVGGPMRVTWKTVDVPNS